MLVMLMPLLMECVVVSPHEQVDRLINDSETMTNSWFVLHCDSAVFFALSTSKLRSMWWVLLSYCSFH